MEENLQGMNNTRLCHTTLAEVAYGDAMVVKSCVTLTIIIIRKDVEAAMDCFKVLLHHFAPKYK